MIFDPQTAKKLEALIHPEVHKALLLLLDTALQQAEDETYSNPAATDAELRQFQGKRVIIKELKDYKKRVNDAIIRDKNASQYTES